MSISSISPEISRSTPGDPQATEGTISSMSYDTPGPYARIALNIFDDERFVDIDDRGALLYLHSIIWSKSHGRDGFVPEGAVKIIARRWGWPDVGQMCQALILAGLFKWEGDDYRVPNFERWQVTTTQREDVARRARIAGQRSAESPQHHGVRGSDGRFAGTETPGHTERTEQPSEQAAEPLPNLRDETRQDETKKEIEPLSPKGDLSRIFEAWAQTLERPNAAKLTPERQRLIKRALSLGYSSDELVRAVTGWQRSAFHRGENRDHIVFNNLKLILRDADHIEQFRDFGDKGKGNSKRSAIVRADSPPDGFTTWDALKAEES